MNNSSPAGGGQYFSSEPDVASRPVPVELLLPDVRLQLTSDRGVFARGSIDPGTKFLLLDGPQPDGDDRNLLDLGCGYGPIALTLARRNPAAKIWAVDVNRRARELCAANAEANGLENVEVIGPGDLPPGVEIDRIWSNPPIRIGKEALHQLLLNWFERLAPNGSAHLVVQKHLGADSLQSWLNRRSWPTERRASKSAFRLLDVHRPTSPDLREMS